MLDAGRETRRSRLTKRAALVAALRSARFVFALLFVLSAIMLPRLGNVRQAAAAADGYIATDVLNLRAEPGTWAEVLDQMWQGSYVTVLDGPTDDGWYMVDYGGEVGWAYGGYLSIDGAAGWSDWEEPAVGGGGPAWVATDSLNVRADASLHAWVMDRLGAGTEISVIGGPVNGFVPIDYFGQRAWVWSDFLAWDGPVESGPERWIDVDRSNGTVTLYTGEEPVATYWASMGWDDSADGFYSTAIGTYYVYGKHEGLAWTEWGQAYIMYWVGFDPSRVNGFHSYSMDENGNVLPNGAGKTGGCVALEPSAAAELFNFATSGMRVEVHW